MADAFKEMTVWPGAPNTPNHTYLLDSDRATAYIPEGAKKPVYFNQPLVIDKRGRKFTLLKKNPFKMTAPDPTLILVKGSKGLTYSIDPIAKTCSCPGFMFRGKCKHLSILDK